MIAFLWLFLATRLFTAPASADETERILWSKDYQLQWKDFEAPARSDDPYDAFISCRIDYNQSGNEVDVFCYFKKNESWNVKEHESEYLLQHEQYHFNIAELYARKFRREISVSGVLSIEKKFQTYIRQSRRVQKAYDEQTDHSKNKEAQEKWERYIDKELKQLDDYAYCRLII
jgi:hypothetical protein